MFLSRDSSETTSWIIFSVCGLIGIFVGLLLAFLVRLGVGVLAGWGGFCLGLILYNAFLYKIDNDAKVAFWCFNIGMAVTAAILSLFLFWHAIIIATSIAGSYAIIRGVSMYAGGFPDEMEVYYMIKMGDLSGMPLTFFIYLGFFVLTAIIFIIFQYKRYGSSDKKGTAQHPYHINGKGKYSSRR